ncbi:hypothetical protein N7492_008195 [Penicillium capsulatum]|uniref:Uncharacterized protein n=1 Tax=Penicillium capsulatum TaxID=69766 RepID=A0A9W9HRF2_9EURO|nr:hypothetical protein N7492_008195 [Penicillium capsulatum]KAJ6105605.1 hypothetical protein N7512_009122 [Penicillium capsulatum]
MSLDPVKGLAGHLPTDQIGSTATDNVQSLAHDPVQQIGDTTKPLSDPVMPGEFPAEGPHDNGPQPEISFDSIWTMLSTWISGLVPRAMDRFESSIQWLVNWLLPPPKQAQVYEAALNRPIASTFLVCQLICCGVPLLVFLAGAFVFGAVAVLLWAVLSLLVLGPILLVASMMGVSLWGWGWIIYGLVKWVDQRFLEGMITRFWLPRMQGQDQDRDEGPQEKKD